MAGKPRPRNVLRQIRRQQRDPFKISLKAVASLSRDERQFWLPGLAPVRRFAADRVRVEYYRLDISDDRLDRRKHAND